MMHLMSNEAVLSSIRCPECQGTSQASMPGNACVYFYECPVCGVLLKPRPGDCCVFCSYGTEACAPRRASPLSLKVWMA